MQQNQEVQNLHLVKKSFQKERKSLKKMPDLQSGFIRVREMSGKLKKFQGQGIVREFYVVSVKNEYLLKCQGNVRELTIL